MSSLRKSSRKTLTKADLDRMTAATAVHLAQHRAIQSDRLIPTVVSAEPPVSPPTPPPETVLPQVFNETYPYQHRVPYREVITFARVARFFLNTKDNYNNLRTLVNIKMRKKSDISLRLIEFFLTKYVSTEPDSPHDIGYFIGQGSRKRYFNVGTGYRQGLDMYTKKCFDFFARGRKFMFGVKGCEILQVETSLRQLNFFKWAITHGVIDYVRKHRKAVSAEMKKWDLEERECKKRERDDTMDMEVDVLPAKRTCLA